MALFDQTKTFTVDNAGEPEPVIVQSYCMKVVIYENAQAGSTDYYIYAPKKTSPEVTKPAGSKAEFSRGYRYEPGDVAGYVALPVAFAPGALTFAQEEGWL